MVEETTQDTKSAKYTSYFEKYMFCIGFLGQSLFYLQAFKIFTSKSALDVSLMGFSWGFISVTSWLVYGVVIKNKVLIVANTVAVIGAALVILGILIYS